VNPHAVGITTAGVVEAWGANKGGELGDGTKTSRNVPVPVSVPSGVTFVTVMAGGLESGAISADGDVYMWGSSQKGILGNGGSTGNQLTPIKVDSGKSMLTGTAANVIDG
jgi:alpha-tubulin suppressor-like RCC1 family protein